MNDIEARNIIKELMNDSAKAPDLFKAGNFWKFYEKNILKEIKKNNLNQFRSWTGASGNGSIISFHGGEVELNRDFKRNFHPFDFKYSIIDDNFFVRKYNSFINKLSSRFPFFSYFAIRASEGRRAYFSKIRQYQESLYQAVCYLDESLLDICDSKFGNPYGFTVGDKFYTSEFLRKLLQINFIKSNSKFEEINSIIELGAGIGLLASCFLKLKKNLKYIVVDIAPTIFFSEYYLKNLGFKVFGYNEFKDNPNITLKKIFETYQVCILPTWKLDLLNNYKADLFVSTKVFQEIEKQQSINYLEIFKKSITKYFYLMNVEIADKALHPGDFGVLNPTTRSDVENELLKEFKIKKKKVFFNIYEILFERIKN